MNVILVVILIHANGYDMLGVQPFSSMAACQAERSRVVDVAYEHMPKGQRYVAECNLIKTAGTSV